MKWAVGKETCRHLRESLCQEWMETNRLGDFASSTVVGCHTRRYHGLLTARLGDGMGPHLLLSAVDETLGLAARTFDLACHNYPGVFSPRGHESLESVEGDAWPRFRYRLGECVFTRELLLLPDQHTLLIRYQADGLPKTAWLRLTPLLAFRRHHDLTRANVDFQVKTFPARNGFKIQPYNSLPPLFLQLQGPFEFFPAPDWYYNFEYRVERERGFPSQEDLFRPGLFELPLVAGKPVFLAAGLDEQRGDLEALWNAEVRRRRPTERAASRSIHAHLKREGARFLVREPDGSPAVIAGYPWFDAWGRDSLIALPGLTFCANRASDGLDQLFRIGETEQDGLIPNCFGHTARHHQFNSIDASLWYVWAVQQMEALTGRTDLVRARAWPVIQRILEALRRGREPAIFVDADGLLHAGHARTQLTWMDATVNGQPVTPRHGCPVEINALWYNALAYADHCAVRFRTPRARCPELLNRIRNSFARRFWVESGAYLGDVARDGTLDASIRPNQIFAVSLPFSPLDAEQQAAVVETVRAHLLTPFGLRTLSPRNPAYVGLYAGSPAQRDGAYHQGSVWPWLLGAFGDACLRVSSRPRETVRKLLDTLTPLFTRHLNEAGLGSVSEIFDGDPPHAPNGCIAQAWSVGELTRLLDRLRKTAPTVVRDWEHAAMGRS